MIVPQLASGARTPMPRYESADSSSIAVATINGKNTTMVVITFGRMSRKINRRSPAPCAIPASTNSFSRRLSTSPRIGRAMYGT